MQHLETTTALLTQLDGDGELSVLDRCQLGNAAAETGVLIHRLERRISRGSLEGELGQLLAATRHQAGE